ncbi:MAG: SAM-dependent methyltransferase, partial [Gammaproteobacteria bacterium]|nr:SAM-dependent methyltransferase [Gammaproteobacteria bacterium]
IREQLPDWFDRVVWLETLPAGFRGFVFGNEVVDAFPVERFTIENGRLRQLAVALDGDAFVWQNIEPSDELVRAVKAIEADTGQGFEEGFVSEVNLWLKPWFAALSRALEQGAIVLLDYGYPRREFYLPQRAAGTLRCYYRHRAHDDPFLLPGLQDITSHVDFTALVEAATDAGLELQGFTSQAQFLLASGLLEHAGAAAVDGSALEQARLSRDVQQLTLPGAMGESFSAIGFSRGIDEVLLGFDGSDQSHRL